MEGFIFLLIVTDLYIPELVALLACVDVRCQYLIIPRPSPYVEGHFPFSPVFLGLNSRRDHCFATSLLVVLSASTLWISFGLCSVPQAIAFLYTIVLALLETVSVGWSSSLHTDRRTYLVGSDDRYHQEMIIKIEWRYLTNSLRMAVTMVKTEALPVTEALYISTGSLIALKFLCCLLREYCFFKKSLGLITNFLWKIHVLPGCNIMQCP